MSEPRANGSHAVDIGNTSGPAPRQQDAGTAPGLGVRLTYGFGTDRGLRRELNEDSFLAVEPIFAVADGMGGHEAGEVASSVVVRTLEASSIAGVRMPKLTAADLEDIIQQADQRIRSEAGGQAGTTLTGVVLVEESGAPAWLFFNVGDSRAYRLSSGTFGQISVDHSEVQELVDLGSITEDEARTHHRRHVVTRALGTGDDADPDFWLMPVEDRDRILLCSDGLSGEVTDEDIHTILDTVRDPQEACDALIAAALRSGARDNVTVIVVDASDPDASDPDVSDPAGDGPRPGAAAGGRFTADGDRWPVSEA
ncbi:PP2C family protein-serine/threonine phosphatase [Arthrobacter antioxidans]|uniref:PP2C family protein-serine/threonine phosphatase n=1 Tax=Arthrobacter antioxidans TaxID=2895818 RepID=UPI001FFECB94|nr:protein phosphatase 2C domain-containing protein [Arthrobacter antioxidans]